MLHVINLAVIYQTQPVLLLRLLLNTMKRAKSHIHTGRRKNNRHVSYQPQVLYFLFCSQRLAFVKQDLRETTITDAEYNHYKW